MGKVFKALQRAEESVGLKKDKREERSEPNLSETQDYVAVSDPQTDIVAEKLTRPGQWDDRLVLATATIGPVAESIRTLRTRILHPSTGKVPRSILVTSASLGEGKSFICANLAISLAQGVDNYCLLADCDLRRPTQHTLFGLSNKAGLADYLQHTKKLPELLVPSGVDKLSILQAGPRSINPAGGLPTLLDAVVPPNRLSFAAMIAATPPAVSSTFG